MAKTKKPQRKSTSQILFAAFAILIILVMVLSSVASAF